MTNRYDRRWQEFAQEVYQDPNIYQGVREMFNQDPRQMYYQEPKQAYYQDPRQTYTQASTQEAKQTYYQEPIQDQKQDSQTAKQGTSWGSKKKDDITFFIPIFYLGPIYINTDCWW